MTPHENLYPEAGLYEVLVFNQDTGDQTPVVVFSKSAADAIVDALSEAFRTLGWRRTETHPSRVRRVEREIVARSIR